MKNVLEYVEANVLRLQFKERLIRYLFLPYGIAEL